MRASFRVVGFTAEEVKDRDAAPAMSLTSHVRQVRECTFGGECLYRSQQTTQPISTTSQPLRAIPVVCMLLVSLALVMYAEGTTGAGAAATSGSFLAPPFGFLFFSQDCWSGSSVFQVAVPGFHAGCSRESYDYYRAC